MTPATVSNDRHQQRGMVYKRPYKNRYLRNTEFSQSSTTMIQLHAIDDRYRATVADGNATAI